MEQRNFKSLNLTLFFFFFPFLPSFSFLTFMPLFSTALVLSLSLEISFILKLKHDYIYIHIHGSRFGYTSECKTHNRLPHRPSSALANHLQPPHHTPPVKLKWVRFRLMQIGFGDCGRNLNRPSHFIKISNFKKVCFL